MSPAGRPLHRLLFNLAAPTIANLAVRHRFLFLLRHRTILDTSGTPVSPLPSACRFYHICISCLNSWLVAVIVGLETKQAPLIIWWEKFVWLSVTYFSSASVAALIVTFSRDLDVSTLAIIGPLLLRVVSYAFEPQWGAWRTATSTSAI